MDGTLINSAEDLVNTCNMLRSAYGLEPLEADVIMGFIGDGVGKLLERTLAGSGIPPAEAKDLMMEFYAQNLDLHTTLYPGVYKGIRDLRKAGWKIALFSNKKEDFCKQILFDFGLGLDFDCVVGDGGGFARKPDPEALLYILDFLKIEDPSSSWMVGDHHTDLEAGQRAGMKTVFCEYGFGNPGEFKPDLRVKNFSEFVNAVLQNE